MMGAQGETRMHQLLGQRYAGCDSNTSATPATAAMMGAGMMGGGYYGPGGWGAMMGSGDWTWMMGGAWQNMTRQDWQRLQQRLLGTNARLEQGRWWVESGRDRRDHPGRGGASRARAVPRDPPAVPAAAGCRRLPPLAGGSGRVLAVQDRPPGVVAARREAAGGLWCAFVVGVQQQADRLGREPGDPSGGLQDRVELLELAADAAADLLAEVEHAGVADRVAHLVALLDAGDHTRGVEDAEVFGDILLGGAKRLLELTDGGVALAKAVEQLDPHRFAEDAEALGDQFDQRLGKRVGYRGREVHRHQRYHNRTVVQLYG